MSELPAGFEERVRRLSPERRRLLERLRAGAAAARSEPLGADPGPVVLRPGDGPARLVLVHPSGGALFCYVPLTRALRPGPAVLGFPSHVSDREPPVERRVGAVAARILAALRRATDPARCVLAGWSYGGSVAFEVVRQLAEQGGGAPPAVLIDPPFLGAVDPPVPDEDELRRQFVYDLSRLHGGRPGARVPGKPPLAELLSAAGVDLGLTEAEVHDRYLTFAAAASALHRYRPPGVYPGPVSLLTAGPEPEITAGWRRSTAGPFRHVVLRGDHHTVFDPDNLRTVLGAVEDALDALRETLRVRA